MNWLALPTDNTSTIKNIVMLISLTAILFAGAAANATTNVVIQSVGVYTDGIKISIDDLNELGSKRFSSHGVCADLPPVVMNAIVNLAIDAKNLKSSMHVSIKSYPRVGRETYTCINALFPVQN